MGWPNGGGGWPPEILPTIPPHSFLMISAGNYLLINGSDKVNI